MNIKDLSFHEIIELIRHGHQDEIRMIAEQVKPNLMGVRDYETKKSKIYKKRNTNIISISDKLYT